MCAGGAVKTLQCAAPLVDLDCSINLITLEKSSCAHESINGEVSSIVAARNVGGA